MCNTKVSDRERPEKCFNCDSTDFIPDVVHFPKEWNYEKPKPQDQDSER